MANSPGHRMFGFNDDAVGDDLRMFDHLGAGQDRKYDLGIGVPTDPKISVGPGGTRVITTVGDQIPDTPSVPMPEDPVGQIFWEQEND